MKRFALGALLSFVTACGSRSGLFVALDSDAAASGGGAGGVSKGGTGGIPLGGSGGTGATGGVTSCTALVPLEPVLAIETEPSQKFDDGLRLVESSDDGAQVTGMFVRQLAPNPANIVRHVSLFPWANWPTNETLGPVYTTGLEANGNAAAGRAAGSRFAVATLLFEATFVPDLDPNASGGGPGPWVKVAGAGATYVMPRAVGVGGFPTHLVGSGDGLSVVGNVILGAVAKKTPRFGCAAPQGPQSGAVAYGDGWLVAASTGAPFGSCDAPNPPVTNPNRIDVFRVGPDGATTLITSIEGGPQIVDVGTAPHPDGLYVVWSEANQPAIRAARVSASTSSVVAGPIDILLPGENLLSFKASAMGNRLAVARHNDFSAGGPALTLTVYDESLASQATGTLESKDVVTGPSSLLGSRDGRSLLVAFTNENKNPWRVRIARFDCSP